MKALKMALIMGMVGFWGCRRVSSPLLPPSDVESISGDNEIILVWTDVDNPDVVSYRIYRNDRPYGYFQLIDEVTTNSYIDMDVINGVTYYYAVSSVDVSGDESELTSYPIFDTPRPERYNQRVFAYSYSHDTIGYSGYLLSEFTPVRMEEGDFYFTYEGGVPKIICAPSTYIQDLGETEDLTDINWAPEDGWNRGDARAIYGHSYVIWTQDNHFAHIRVVKLTDDYMLFDVAYQTDPANHELSIEKSKTIKFKKTWR